MNVSLGIVWRGAWSGKTLGRILFNEVVHQECKTLSGEVLDLAGGEDPGYLRQLPQGFKLTRSNRTASEGVAEIDFNKPLPFADNSFDSVLLFNALYIAEDSLALAREINRVIKPKGSWYFSSPFVYNEMPEPHDYVRYSAEGLERLCKLAGFSNIRITRVGERASAAANIVTPFFVFRFVRALMFPLAIMLDRLIPKKLKHEHPTPILYFVQCEKI